MGSLDEPGNRVRPTYLRGEVYRIMNIHSLSSVLRDLHLGTLPAQV